jgi:uncharacterized repeat protein (TIGR01451 family)
MKKLYTSTLLVFVLGLFFSFSSFGQLVVKNDNYELDSSSGFVANIGDNDSFNFTNSYKIFEKCNVIYNGLPKGISGNEVGNILIQPFTLTAGKYIFTYTISEKSNPNNSATGTVTIIITCENNPIVSSVTQPSCTSNTGSITFTNLMPGWTISSSDTKGGTNISGFDNQITIKDISPGDFKYDDNYTFFVERKCSVNSVAVQVVLKSISTYFEVSIIDKYEDYNNDGIVNVGDIINYQYSFTNKGSCPIFLDVPKSNIVLNFNGEISNLGVGVTDNTSLKATHAITQNEINSGKVLLESTVVGSAVGTENVKYVKITTPLTTSNGIKLNAFIDTNANGIQDGTEKNFTQGKFQYQLNSGVMHDVISSFGTLYLYETNPANIYNISYVLPDNGCPSQYTLTTSSYTNLSVTEGSGVLTYNFPITTVPCSDLAVFVTNYSAAPRPGFIYQNYVTYSNYGNQTIASGTINFNKDTALKITAISQAGTTLTTNGFSFNFTNLLPNETRKILVSMQVPTIPTIALGNLLTNSATITIPVGDAIPENNSSSISQTIIGSWDPNDIVESHGEKILHSSFTTNDYLTYTIQFENTGTASAINIKVNNILNTKLDESSIKMVASSSSYVLDRVGKTLNWNFDGINLPPSIANTTTGKGYIVFQVKPKAGYAISDIIPSVANIYFDFNPAIVTNTWKTEFTTTLATNQFENADFVVYPNPTKNKVNIALKNNLHTIDAVIVNDILGKTMLTKNVKNQNTEVDLSNFSNGVYFVKVKANGNEKIVKLIKE